ncbi:limbic system-associated membrane protein-like [Gigantopelta aegis]|uniref:limbic system-associated membrane protein-like n=1 Tax=Gigantopelta aegis TaxID=1735272 RepID=UPI001B8890BB|nr:limbic system-associated membrane protein-like [Gigantopelta aegis]
MNANNIDCHVRYIIFISLTAGALLEWADINCGIPRELETTKLPPHHPQESARELNQELLHGSDFEKHKYQILKLSWHSHKLSMNCRLRLPGKKSDLIDCLEQHVQSTHDVRSETGVSIMDGAVLVNILRHGGCKTFGDYTAKVFVPHIKREQNQARRAVTLYPSFPKWGKKTAWKVWGTHDEFTKAFYVLHNSPEQISEEKEASLDCITSLCLFVCLFSGSVILEPNFDVPVVNVTVKESATAILPCSVKYLGQHQVVWTDQWSTLLTFEDRRIIDDERMSIERPYTKDWNLHIRSVKHSDQGVYHCQINTNPVKIKTVNLHVQVPAAVIGQLSSRDLTAVEGDTVSLVCNVTGIPEPTVTWYRHKATLDSIVKERIGVSGEVLMIHNVSRYCGDVYECVAFNGVPPAVNRLMKIVVEFAPEVRLPNKRIGQDTGKETILECVISANPVDKRVWLRDGVEIANSHKYRLETYDEGDNTITLSLKIKLLEDDDFGKYTCFASNDLGSDKESMVLYDYSAYRRPATVASVTTTRRTKLEFKPFWRTTSTTTSPSRVYPLYPAGESIDRKYFNLFPRKTTPPFPRKKENNLSGI